jgi:hypothetical protein
MKGSVDHTDVPVLDCSCLCSMRKWQNCLRPCVDGLHTLKFLQGFAPTLY